MILDIVSAVRDFVIFSALCGLLTCIIVGVYVGLEVML